jgi:hypothetical protein
MRPGQYPYVFDGAVKGTIFVIVRSGPIGTSGPYTGPSSGREGCGHPIVYPYDVRDRKASIARHCGPNGFLSRHAEDY